MPNPTDSAYPLRDLFARLSALELAQHAQATRTVTTVETATVQAYTGGSTTCTVEYDGGETRVLPFLTSYTPVVADLVAVLNSPAWSAVLGVRSA